MTRRLLIINYFHPPDATGVRRTTSLMRWLPGFGWRCAVLTCRAKRGAGHDPGPLDHPAIARAPVARTESLDPYRLLERFRPSADPLAGSGEAKGDGGSQRAMALLRNWLFVPDDRVGWVPFAIRRGAEIVRRQRIDAILSTSYPHSAHLVARGISRRTGVPWLADFRDGWTQNPVFFPGASPPVQALSRRLERSVAETADAVVTVSHPISAHLASLRPADRSPILTITNGFEPDRLLAKDRPTDPLTPGRWTVLYSGRFFGPRRPDTLFDALARVLRESPDLAREVCVRFRSALAPREQALFDRLGLGTIADSLPMTDFEAIQQEQARADAFLLVIERGPGAEIMLTQKLFEYLAARRPIFAIAPEGAAADLLRSVGGAVVCGGEAPADIAGGLRAFLRSRGATAGPLPGDAALAPFCRREQARRFASILDAL